MKYITFLVPCYNSEEYMEHCVDSLLVGGDDVEIIIVNDGSTDKTKEIADKYQEKYPNIVRAVHQENGGHGSAINKGLELATGLYYKVIDSDDWVDEEALNKLLDSIKNNSTIDMYVVDYVYEKKGEEKVVISYEEYMPENKVFGWDDVGKFKIWQYLLMHSLVFNTDFLRSTKIVLPEKTSYDDHILSCYPLKFVKTMYYLNIEFYHYFIGRDDQSVNEANMLKRLDQQLNITRLLIDMLKPYEYSKNNKNCSKYVIHHMYMIITITVTLLNMENTEQRKKDKKELLNYLKKNDKKLYNSYKNSIFGFVGILRKTNIRLYYLMQKVFKFN